MMDQLKELLKNKKNVAIILIVLVFLLFPIPKKSQVTYVGKNGVAGTLFKERNVPWWFPSAFLKSSVPLESASKEDVKNLAAQAYKKKDIEKLKVIERSYPEVHELVIALESEVVSKEKQDNTSTKNNSDEEPNLSSSAGGTLEARIPAKIEGFKFVTESRSLLSWTGVYRPEKDLNIDVLEVTIEMIGKEEASREVEKMKEGLKSDLSEITVKGLRAYFAVVSPREARVFFQDGDFYYEFKLTLKGGASEYKEKLKEIAEKAYL